MTRRPLAIAGRTFATGAAALAVVTLRWSLLHWGATTEECLQRLPGDDVLPDADLVATRAITIEVPPEKVWPWLVQIGADRGGFYSYDALENLAGCKLRSAESVVPEWQSLDKGDVVLLHPRVGLSVSSVDAGRSLVLHAAPAMPPGAARAPYDFTWSFELRRHPHLATRLVARERFAYAHAWSPVLVEPIAAASSVMTRRMLRGIRDRAERPSAAA